MSAFQDQKITKKEVEILVTRCFYCDTKNAVKSPKGFFTCWSCKERQKACISCVCSLFGTIPFLSTWVEDKGKLVGEVYIKCASFCEYGKGSRVRGMRFGLKPAEWAKTKK